jgi:hypothetical protein
MELLNDFVKVIYTIFLAIYCMIFPSGSYMKEREGFVSLPGLRSGDLSLYPNGSEVSGRGSDNRYRIFEPYLRQTELSSRDQRDNHKWPVGRTLVGSTEQSLSSAPVLPCSYPRPKMGGEALHSREDSVRRNKLMHSPVMF